MGELIGAGIELGVAERGVLKAYGGCVRGAPHLRFEELRQGALGHRMRGVIPQPQHLLSFGFAQQLQ